MMMQPRGSVHLRGNGLASAIWSFAPVYIESSSADSESTALGTALLAAIGAGLLDEPDAPAVAATARAIEPAMDGTARATEREAWRDFVGRAVSLSPRAAAGGGADH